MFSKENSGLEKVIYSNHFVMALSIRNMHTPRPHSQGICQLFNILLVPVVGICQNTSARGWTFVNSSRSGLSRSFFNISLKNKIIKNIFNTYALKRYLWFSLHHFPTPGYFFASV